MLYTPAAFAGKHYVCKIDLARDLVETVPTDFMVHSICPYPNDAGRVLAIEKWGKSAAIIDFDSLAVARTITSAEGTSFYGHGVFAPDAASVFITQVHADSGRGHLAGFDPDSFDKITDMDVTAGGLHECHIAPDPQYLMVTSSGLRPKSGADTPTYGVAVERSALMTVEIKSGKVVHRREAPDNDQNIGHFAISATGDIVAISSPYANTTHAGKIYVGYKNQDLFLKAEIPDAINSKLVGEMLSVSIHADGKSALVSNPGSNNILSLDISSAQVSKAVTVQGANGVVFDKNRNEFIVTGKDIAHVDQAAILSDLPLSGSIQQKLIFRGHSTL